MHYRSRRVGERAYTFDSHSRLEHIVKHRQCVEHWLLNYPEEHVGNLLSRFHAKDDSSYEAAVFELFLHDQLYTVADRLEVEGLISDSGKHADFVLHLNGHGAIDVEAMSLPWDMDLSSKNVKLVNQYVGEMKSSDFSIWFDQAQIALIDTPKRRIVQDWVNRVLGAHSWDEADRLVEADPERFLAIEPLILGGCRINAQLLVRLPEMRSLQSCLGMAATSTEGWHYDTRIAVTRNKILAKIKAKKRKRTSTPFILAVNINSFTFFNEEHERKILYGSREHQEDGVWAFADGRPRKEYSRCSAVWFFDRVGPLHSHGRRNAFYRNRFIDQDAGMATLAKVAENVVGLPGFPD